MGRQNMWGILINHVTEGEGREREPPDKRGSDAIPLDRLTPFSSKWVDNL